MENLFWILQVITGYMIALAFVAGVLILLYLQVRLMLFNMTTIEYFESWNPEDDERENQFYVNPSANFYQIFGPPSVWYLWPLPIQSNQNVTGGGSFFPSKKE